MSTLRLQICDRPKYTAIFRQIMDAHHAYMKYKDTCNRRINWLVYWGDVVIGAVGINSAILAMSPRDKFIGWTAAGRKQSLNCIANNYRFCLIRGIPQPENSGTRVLKLLREAAPMAWKIRYGDPLVLLETLVKPPWSGAVYKADNWTCVGKTQGTSFSKAPVALWKKETGIRGRLARENPEEAVRQYAVGGKKYLITKSEPKIIFCKPLVSNWKLLLCGCGVNIDNTSAFQAEEAGSLRPTAPNL